MAHRFFLPHPRPECALGKVDDHLSTVSGPNSRNMWKVRGGQTRDYKKRISPFLQGDSLLQHLNLHSSFVDTSCYSSSAPPTCSPLLPGCMTPRLESTCQNLPCGRVWPHSPFRWWNVNRRGMCHSHLTAQKEFAVQDSPSLPFSDISWSGRSLTAKGTTPGNGRVTRPISGSLP